MKGIIVGIVLSSAVVSKLLAAQDDGLELGQLRQEVNELKQMMLELKQSNNKLKGFAEEDAVNVSSESELSKLKGTVNEMKTELEGNSKSGFQLAGYSSFDWADTQGEDNEFNGVKFAPIFLYQYGQLFQFEGEVEMKVKDDGTTDTELEYATGTLFLNDYMGLQMGKFMSPLGQFVQNLHPSWINKLPSTPVGFGHDGAAPTSNVGVALRGGLPKIANIRSNYALFISNAPTFGVADDGDIGIDASGKTTSSDVSKTWGGRFAVDPLSGMEVGISGATGKAAEELVFGDTIARDYDVFGIDLMYNINSIDVKAEYIQQKIGENILSPLKGGTWRAWYAQLSYQFSSLKIEPVLRYSDYHNPEQERNQWALGLNYLFANNVIAKLAYEYNTDEDDGAVNSSANNNRVLAQFAFGF